MRILAPALPEFLIRKPGRGGTAAPPVFFAVLLAALMMLPAAGCQRQSAPQQPPSAPRPRTITDRAGNETALPARMDRIISGAPSNSEIIAGLGLGDKIIAIDTYSAGIEGINAKAVQIDFGNPDAEALIGLNPDLIIAAGVNMFRAGEDAFKLISDAGIPVFYIPTSNSIEEIYQDIEFLARLLNAREKGDTLVTDMKRQVNEIAAIGAGITDKASVYFEISPAPYIYSMGRETFINQMIEIVGAKNIFDDVTGWIAPGAESIIERNPDVILSNVNYIDNPLGEIKSRDGFSNISAVKNNRLYLIDANSSRPSHHVAAALQQIAKAVYPDKYE
jgi:iron complex transport system substrate-binding protein